MNTDPTNIGWSAPHYVDASIAVRLVITEDEESTQLQGYLINGRSNHFHITEFAFYETLSVLKRKLLKGKIDGKQYRAAVIQLAAYLEDNLLQIDSDFRLDNFKVIYEVGELVDTYSLDYSDALQIYTLLKGQWRGTRANCTAVFVTADSDLAKAAKREGLRVWNPLEEPNPPNWDESDKRAGTTS